MPADRQRLEQVLRDLESIPLRGSASEGEHEAARRIAARFEDLGCPVSIEAERAHGTYWWPLGSASTVAALAGALGSRRIATALGGVMAAAIYDDVSGGRLWFRRPLQRRTTQNVVAEAGEREAQTTVIVVAHHDAAHSGLIFHPAVNPWLARRFPKLYFKSETSPPIMAPVFLGPAMVGIGAALRLRRLRRFGTLSSAATAVVMADIARSDVVPGANDNLTSVAAVLELGRLLTENPVEGVRVLLVSTGSEESFMEGMQGFARRHFPTLDRSRTHVICLETLGSPLLALVEGEGMLRMRDYDTDLKDLIAGCAAELGLDLRRGLRVSLATDGLIALRAGYPTATISAVDDLKYPSNYHWPTDIADNVDFATVARGTELAEATIRRLAERS